MNVQRLESEDVYPITFPRVPGNFLKIFMFLPEPPLAAYSLPVEKFKQLPQKAVYSTSLPIQKNEIGKSRKLLKEYKNQLAVSQQQLESGIGLLLGDASLQTQDQGKTYRLKFEVGEKNSEYLTHIKNEIFNDYILSEPNVLH